MLPKIFLLHIQKTAGRAVAAYLAEQYPTNERGFPPSDPPTALDAKAEQILSGYPKPAQQWIRSLLDRQLIADGIHVDANVWRVLRHRYAGVTVLREPRERVLSLYNMWNTWPESQIKRFNPVEQEAYRFAKTHSIAETLGSGLRVIRMMMHDTQTRQLATSLQDISDASRDTRKALETLDSFEVVGVTEMIEATMRCVCHRFGWAPQSTVAPIGIGTRKAQLDSLGDEDRAALDNATRLDQLVYRHALERLDHDLASMPASPPIAVAPRADEHGRLTITMNDPVPGQGWNVREGPPESPLRWTGPDRTSVVRAHLPDGCPYTFRLRLAGFMAPDIFEGLRVTVGDHPCRWTHRREARDLLVEATIPEAAVDTEGPTEVVLTVPRTLSHHDLDPAVPDRRHKGLTLARVEFAVAEIAEASP